MIKTEVTMILRGTPKRKLVWKGKVSYVPRVGETIFLSTDGCGYDVHNVYMVLPTDSVHINILDQDENFYDDYKEINND